MNKSPLLWSEQLEAVWALVESARRTDVPDAVEAKYVDAVSRGLTPRKVILGAMRLAIPLWRVIAEDDNPPVPEAAVDLAVFVDQVARCYTPDETSPRLSSRNPATLFAESLASAVNDDPAPPQWVSDRYNPTPEDAEAHALGVSFLATAVDERWHTRVQSKSTSVVEDVIAQERALESSPEPDPYRTVRRTALYPNVDTNTWWIEIGHPFTISLDDYEMPEDEDIDAEFSHDTFVSASPSHLHAAVDSDVERVAAEILRVTHSLRTSSWELGHGQYVGYATPITDEER